MATWAEFEAASPDLAAISRRLLVRGAHGDALLATVRGSDLAPRIHPIGLDIVDGRLVAFINDSPKRADLAIDGRYALHNHMDATVPEECTLRGRATKVDASDPFHATVAARWYFEPDESYDLYVFDIASALVGQRRDTDEGPPRYRSWKAADGGGR